MATNEKIKIKKTLYLLYYDNPVEYKQLIF